MIHLWAVAGSGTYPVCGQSAKKGEVVTQAFYSDLCRACVGQQERKSAIIKKQIRKRRGL